MLQLKYCFEENDIFDTEFKITSCLKANFSFLSHTVNICFTLCTVSESILSPDTGDKDESRMTEEPVRGRRCVNDLLLTEINQAKWIVVRCKRCWQ